MYIINSHFARCVDVIFRDEIKCHDETSTSATSGTIWYKSCFETYDAKQVMITVVLQCSFVLMYTIYCIQKAKQKNDKNYTLYGITVLCLSYASHCYLMLEYLVIDLDNNYHVTYSSWCTVLCNIISISSITILLVNYIYYVITQALEVNETIDAVIYYKILYFISIVNAIFFSVIYFDIYLPSKSLVSIPNIDSSGFNTKQNINLTINKD